MDSLENQEPTCQADMLPVMFMDKDDPNPGMIWASRLDVAEFIELARRKRIELGVANPAGRERTGPSSGSKGSTRKDAVAQCWMVVFPRR